MLRHFKMELKRQQLEQTLASQENVTWPSSCPMSDVINNQPTNLTTTNIRHTTQGPTKLQQQSTIGISNTNKPADMDDKKPAPPKRVRGRRSSKPMMEKRRRARINECLDILKSYVLTDTNNLTHLGIDATANENRDEETIARTILKSSGLINRHRGRKNPNKLEKADILELTVDYVRRLHEQRDQLLTSSSNHITTATKLGHNQHQTSSIQYSLGNNQLPEFVPAHLNQPLTLDLSPRSRLQSQSTPPSPPPSSASSSPNAELLGVHNNNNNNNQQQPYNLSKMILSRVFEGNYVAMYDWKAPTY